MLNMLRQKLQSFVFYLRSSLRSAKRPTPVMAILFAMTTSLLLYQNCSPAAPLSASDAKSSSNYSSLIGVGGTGSTPSGSSGSSGGAIAVPGGTGGSTGGTPSTGGGTGGAVPIDSGGGTGTIGSPIGSGGSGGTGVNPGGSTGGASNALVWQYQPEDRTAEEGEVLTLSAYATKGIDVVTYQWYRNGQPIAGQTSYLYRAYLLPLSAAGTYYVIARSGTDSIQSVSITVRVRAARNPCPAGNYGIYPGTSNYNELWHESMIGAVNARQSVPRELADGYTIRLNYAGVFALPNCFQATALYQCRNGRLIMSDRANCDTAAGN